MPTFTDLYYSVGGHKADPNLKAEKLHALEGGVKFLGRGIRAVGTAYYNRGYDLIDWIMDTSAGDDAPWMSMNHTRLNTFGQEVTVRMTLPDMLGRPDFFFRTLNLGYTHQSQDKSLEPHLRSLYSLEYIRHKVVVQADFKVKNLALDLSWRYIDRNTGSALLAPYSLLGQQSVEPHVVRLRRHPSARLLADGGRRRQCFLVKATESPQALY